MTRNSLDSIAEEISGKSLPPVHLWNPALTRDVDMRIARNGDWYYQGSRIDRIRMVKLFSTVLRVDDGETYLVTPQERLRIQVEDAHFTAVLVDRHESDGQQVLVFTTNIEEQIIADEQHTVFVRYQTVDGEPSPYLNVRSSLTAMLSRTVFYQLAEWAEEQDGVVGVRSCGLFMPLYDSGASL